MNQQTLQKIKETEQTAILISSQQANIEKTVELFKTSFKDYKKEILLPALKNLYASNAFLNDRIHIIEGQESIITYFTSTFDKIEQGQFEVTDVVYGKKDVYVRWIMRLQFKGKKELHDFPGMSQLRFNQEGKILFHFDYWDFSELLEHVPVMKQLIRFVRKQA